MITCPICKTLYKGPTRESVLRCACGNFFPNPLFKNEAHPSLGNPESSDAGSPEIDLLEVFSQKTKESVLKGNSEPEPELETTALEEHLKDLSAARPEPSLEPAAKPIGRILVRQEPLELEVETQAPSVDSQESKPNPTPMSPSSPGQTVPRVKTHLTVEREIAQVQPPLWYSSPKTWVFVGVGAIFVAILSGGLVSYQEYREALQHKADAEQWVSDFIKTEVPQINTKKAKKQSADPPDTEKLTAVRPETPKSQPLDPTRQAIARGNFSAALKAVPKGKEGDAARTLIQTLQRERAEAAELSRYSKLKKKTFDQRLAEAALWTYSAAKLRNKAFPVLRTLGGERPSDPVPVYLAGEVALRNQDRPRAIKEYRRALERSKEFFPAWLRLVQTASFTSSDEARETISEAFGHYPDDTRLFPPAIQSLHRHGHQKNAYELAERWVALRPNDVNAIRALARAEIDHFNNLHKATQTLSTALQSARSPADRSTLHHALAEIYEREEKLPAAIAEVERGLKQKKTIDLELYRGELLIRAKEYREAERAFKSILKTNPKVAGAHLGLGVLYLRQKKNKAAIEALTQSLKLSPTDRGYMKLAEAYLESGNRRGARAALIAGLRLNPAHPDGPALKRRVN